MGIGPIEVNHTVGAIKLTILATDAFIRIMHSDAVVEFMHGPGGAAPDAWGVFAMIAQGGHIMVANIRKGAGGLRNLIGPIDAILDIVFNSTGDAAGTAPDTSLQVDYHGISGHETHLLKPFLS